MGVKGDLQPDHFFYDQALRLIERERGGPPLSFRLWPSIISRGIGRFAPI
jgi:hypothetical protein